MKRFIEIKHVGPRAQVQQLLAGLCDRIEEKLRHFSADTVTLHVLFEESGTHKLYRTAVTCHVPGHTVAAHEENRVPGACIREAFAELSRQLEKQKAIVRHEHDLRRSKRLRRAPTAVALVLSLLAGATFGRCEDAAPSSHAVEAIRLLDSKDPYQRELGFLRLEALREPSTAETIKRYLGSRDVDTRAYSLRALAAIQGPAAIPTLLDALAKDRHPTPRRAALLGLEPLHHNDPMVIAAFLKALRDRKPEVRMAAVDIVSRLGTTDARAAIQKRLKRERDHDVRRVLALARQRMHL